jgi:lactate dehydrogenase-like 2-hydroxyacid dehydrogenase
MLVIAQIPPTLREALAVDNDLVDHVLEGARDRLAAVPSDFEAIVTRALFGVPPEILDAMPRLKAVFSLGAGTDRIDLDALARRRIALFHTPDDLMEDVADDGIGLLYAAQRNIVRADRFVRAGDWARHRFGYSRRVSNRRIGIVGLGRIGGRVAEKARALGMSVAYLGRVRSDTPDYERFNDIDALAGAVDILVLTCSRTPETHHRVKASTLRTLGADGIVINVARGEVIDERALIEALRSGMIAGAALDVFEHEPTPNPALLDLDTVILSPHAASLTHEAREAMNLRLVRATRAYFAGAAERSCTA